MIHSLTCPVCSNTLSIDKTSLAKYSSLSCAQGHLFDFAKQGYLNLLLSQHKRSKQPGDTLEMVQARTRFLNKGFYDGISNFLIDECLFKTISNESNLFPNKHTHFHYADLACGEGFYTQRIHEHLVQEIQHVNPQRLVATTGLDISAPAIKAACQRTKQVLWLISSLARTPLANDSQDLITGLFFHFDLDEIERVLKPQGHFIMVTTGPSHLIELREIIYDTVKEETTKDFSHIQGSLSHIKTRYFKETKTLGSKEDILSLLAMTPHYWRCTLNKKQHLESLNKLSVTLDIQFDIFSKK